ncbi:MAG: 3-oxoacyl-ACP reductase FabG [Planctomycetes bacterium]|nr:3-oxoacyl-ACP reductase FabG [Planctomycetota bacterium]
MLLEGKVAVVTGGGRGIGAAIVRRLAQEGAAVVFCDISLDDETERLAREVTEAGGKVRALTADVRKYQDAERVVKTAQEEFGRVDILINNAGVIRDTLVLTMSPEDWDLVLSVNLTGVYNFSKAAALVMLRQRSGKIINLSSVAGASGGRGQANYAASKGGINAFTRALALELGKRNITVNAVAPGVVATSLSKTVRTLTRDAIKKMIPLRRYAEPQEIAEVVLFLASPAADYITGQVITVDGGLSIGPTW